MEKYTKLELQILESIRQAGDETTIIRVSTIEYFSGISTKRIRGVVASLIKKKALAIDDGNISVFDKVYIGSELKFEYDNNKE